MVNIYKFLPFFEVYTEARPARIRLGENHYRYYGGREYTTFVKPPFGKPFVLETKNL